MSISCIRIALSREAIIAFCLGFFFPLLGFLLLTADTEYPYSLASLFQVHRDNPLIWVIDTAPWVLWVMGSLIATYRYRSLREIRTLDKDRKNTRLILDSAADGIFILDSTATIISANQAAHRMFGYSSDEFVSKNIALIRPEKYAARLTDYLAQAMTGEMEPFSVFEQEGLRKDESCFPVEFSVSIVGEDIDTKIILVVRDVSERKALEDQLNQAQKLESIGQLAAGIAHEINTPIQYINDNMRTISEYLVDIQALGDRHQLLLAELEKQQLLDHHVRSVRDYEQQCDLEFMLEDAPQAMYQSLQGIQRVSEIVMAMKSFSYSGGGHMSMLDINDSLKSTLVVARNEFKYIAKVKTDFAELPLVECYAGELNQVFLNLIINAAHAIEEKGGENGLISISTLVVEDGGVEIVIEDNGCGIPEEIHHKVFDPFFTTKEVGKGTGQGLNLAFQVIEQKHKGRIFFESEVGKGTQFKLRIPEKMQVEKSEVAAQPDYRQAIG